MHVLPGRAEAAAREQTAEDAAMDGAPDVTLGQPGAPSSTDSLSDAVPLAAHSSDAADPARLCDARTDGIDAVSDALADASIKGSASCEPDEPPDPAAGGSYATWSCAAEPASSAADGAIAGVRSTFQLTSLHLSCSRFRVRACRPPSIFSAERRAHTAACNHACALVLPSMTMLGQCRFQARHDSQQRTRRSLGRL